MFVDREQLLCCLFPAPLADLWRREGSRLMIKALQNFIIRRGTRSLKILCLVTKSFEGPVHPWQKERQAAGGSLVRCQAPVFSGAHEDESSSSPQNVN